MPSFTVFKGSKSGDPVKSTTTKPDELKEDSVLVKVTVSGLCGTGELHYLHFLPEHSGKKLPGA